MNLVLRMLLCIFLLKIKIKIFELYLKFLLSFQFNKDLNFLISKILSRLEIRRQENLITNSYSSMDMW
jgi:hypothetical protein